MTDTNKVIVNTLSQNLRTILNILISLYTTRLVLKAIGEESYGIFMLIAGITSFLGYITNSMIITTQRHLSFSFGQDDAPRAKTIFQNSCILHIVLGGIFVVTFVTLAPILFDMHFLNIKEHMLAEAKNVYYMVTLSVFFTFLTAPYRAAFTAHENIIYISIIDVFDGLIKLSLISLLFIIENNRLTVYAGIISFVMLINYLALAIYGKSKYPEMCIIPSLKCYSYGVMKDLVSFATFTLYGTVCIFVRSQGIAVVLNKIFNITVNAAYGIANQVFGAVQFLSQAILNAISPQIIKSEGAGNRKRMLYLSEQACKYCFLSLACFSIPLIFEMENVLSIWLGTTPKYSAFFCKLFLIAALCDQLTIGFNVAKQALGDIKTYTVVIYSIKILTLPVIWILLLLGIDLRVSMSAFVALELVAALCRIPFMAKAANITIGSYSHNVLFKILPPLFSLLACGFIMNTTPFFSYRFVLSEALGIIIGGLTTWVFCLSKEDKNHVKNNIIGKAVFYIGKK